MLCLLASLLAAAPGEPSELVVADDLPAVLVAAEPLVEDPVAIRFDADGRLWVVEMPDYPTGPADGEPPRGRVVTLADDDGDGISDRRTVFADGLLMPTGVQPFGSGKDVTGAIVTLAGEVAYLEDTDGDGRADRRTTWIAGLAEGNEQLRSNHPTIGPDGWLYVANGLRTVDVTDVRDPESKPVRVRGRDFRFRLDRPGIEPVTGHGQFGMTFDRWGRRFTCSNARPCDYAVFTTRDLALNPLLRNPVAVDEVVPGGQGRPVHPLVTQWTTSILHTGSFTAACGIHTHLAAPLPPTDDELSETVLICEPTGSLVHAERLRPRGASFAAAPYPADRAFLASTDPWFRPVDLTEGPDGCLYVVDMHRKVIEHPHWMTEEARARADFDSGRGMGRIYRIGTPQTIRDRLPLAQLTAPRNGWEIAAARQSLAESPITMDGLAADTSLTPDARIRVRQWLAGQGQWSAEAASRDLARLLALSEDDAVDLADELFLDTTTPASRELAGTLRLLYESGHELQPPAEDDGRGGTIRDAATLRRHYAMRLTRHRDPLVRMLADLWPERVPRPAMLRRLDRDLLDPWLRQAAALAFRPDDRLSVHGFTDEQSLRRIAADAPSKLSTQARLALLRDQAEFAARSLARSDDATTVGHAIDRWRRMAEKAALAEANRGGEPPGPIPVVTFLMLGFADGGFAGQIGDEPLKRREGLAAIAGLVGLGDAGGVRDQTLLNDQIALAQDRSQPMAIRAAAIRLLAHLSDDEMLLSGLWGTDEAAIRREALAGFRLRRDLLLPAAMLDGLDTQPPALRESVLAAAMASADRQRQLLDAVRDGRLDPVLIGAAHSERLRESGDDRIAAAAADLLPAFSGVDAETWQRYLTALHPSEGDAARGRAAFVKHCGVCHRVGDVAGAAGRVGPELSDVRTKTREQLLEAILRPSAAIDADYVAYLARTDDGRVVSGVIVAESDAAVTLRGADGRDVALLRDELDGLKTTGRSLMPEGLHRTIDPQTMSDLVHWMKTWRFAE